MSWGGTTAEKNQHGIQFEYPCPHCGNFYYRDSWLPGMLCCNCFQQVNIPSGFIPVLQQRLSPPSLYLDGLNIGWTPQTLTSQISQTANRERKNVFHLYINPSCERVWRIEFEDASGKRSEPVEFKALTFQDAIHEWWQGESENFPNDVEIELGSTIGGVLTLYIENDQLTIWDVTKEYDPDSVSCAELVERRKQEREARKARK